MVPAMKYCIYCGEKLPAVIPPSRISAAQPQIPPVPSVPSAPSRLQPSPPPPAQPPVSIEIEKEILDLMSNISIYYERKVALLNMFKSGEISEGIFLKLHEEYSRKLNDFLNIRVRRMEDLRKKLGERKKRFDEVNLNLEELEVRHKIGEIDTPAFTDAAEKLRAEKKMLDTIVKGLVKNLDHLEKLLADKPPKKILEFEVNVRACYETLEKMVEDGKLSLETMNKIKPDYEETLVFFDSLIGERKKKEKTLREQLESLQARYRVSEVSIEEYEMKKRELQGEIDKIWT